MATVELFKVLLEKDSEKEIISAHVKTLNKKQVPNKYLNIIEYLPTETGLYYIHNKEGKIIYIGKSKNIKKRVLTHLTGKARKAEKIQKALHSVTYELCGNECLALLKEQHEIKKNPAPIKSRAQISPFCYGDSFRPLYSVPSISNRTGATRPRLFRRL